ncbi:hypothetical protein ACFV84_02030 [Kitasatospora sp. NPDC059811]|uniref:hypothetical protein n=1 Tax=Kitasatospora sp. NPDC059811 TaxID=3346957 RepID=UPI00365FA8E8
MDANDDPYCGTCNDLYTHLLDPQRAGRTLCGARIERHPSFKGSWRDLGWRCALCLEDAGDDAPEWFKDGKPGGPSYWKWYLRDHPAPVD